MMALSSSVSNDVPCMNVKSSTHKELKENTNKPTRYVQQFLLKCR